MSDDAPDVIRILLVDDNADFVDEAIAFLAGLRAVKVVGWSFSAQGALDVLPGQEVDLVLMDFAMPGIGGLEATRRIKQAPDPPRVVILSVHDDPAYEGAAARAGADGFLNKSDVVTGLVPLLGRLFPGRRGRGSPR